MFDAWTIIGCSGSCNTSDIPKVLTSIIIDPTNTFVAYVDIANSIDDIINAPRSPKANFSRNVVLGEATRLPPTLWEPGAILLLTENSLEMVSLWEAEIRMNQFVRTRRKEGRAALELGDKRAALEAFDLARRVSNEPEDIRLVADLSPPDIGKIYRDQLLFIAQREAARTSGDNSSDSG